MDDLKVGYETEFFNQSLLQTTPGYTGLESIWSNHIVTDLRE